VKSHTCPSCGTPVINSHTQGVTFVAATGVVTYEGRTCQLRPTQIDILELLLEAHPRPLESGVLFAALYASRGDGEEPSNNAMTAQISDMRKRFKTAGMDVTISTCDGFNQRRRYALLLGAEQSSQKQVA
jgi:DNA-binding winged helix-turn-helix (wHTH) protein